MNGSYIIIYHPYIPPNCALRPCREPCRWCFHPMLSKHPVSAPHRHIGSFGQHHGTWSPEPRCMAVGWWHSPVCHGSVAGWWFQPTPLKNDGVKVSWDDDIPNVMEKNISQVPNHQPDRFWPILIWQPARAFRIMGAPSWSWVLHPHSALEKFKKKQRNIVAIQTMLSMQRWWLKSPGTVPAPHTPDAHHLPTANSKSSKNTTKIPTHQTTSWKHQSLIFNPPWIFSENHISSKKKIQLPNPNRSHPDVLHIGLLQTRPRRPEATRVDHDVAGLLARAAVAAGHVQLNPEAARGAFPGEAFYGRC